MPWISYRARTNALSRHNFARSPSELCARLSCDITRNESVMNNRRLTEVGLLRVPIDLIRATFWLVRRTRCSRGITINCSPMCLSPFCIYSIPASLALRISSISAFACTRTCVISQSTNSKSLVPGPFNPRERINLVVCANHSFGNLRSIFCDDATAIGRVL